MIARDWEDFATFFDPTDFGTPATFDGVAEPVNGILTAPHEVAAQGGGVGVSTVRMMFTTAELDLPPAPLVGGRVTIGADTYVIAQTQPDGTGMVRLILEKE